MAPTQIIVFRIQRRNLFYDLSECNAVAVGRDHAEFTNAPRLIRDPRKYDGTAIDEFGIDLIHIFDKAMSEPRMVAGRLGGHFVRAFAEHYLEIAKREKLPARGREIENKAKFRLKIFSRDRQVLYGKYVPCVDNPSFVFHLVNYASTAFGQNRVRML